MKITQTHIFLRAREGLGVWAADGSQVTAREVQVGAGGEPGYASRQMKKLATPSIADVRLLLQTPKVAVREMEWVKKPTPHNPPWELYECACEMLNEVREDLIFRMQYRHMKTELVGQASIKLPAKFNAALFVGPHRVAALDMDSTPHTNKIGNGLKFHGMTISGCHLHIWIEKGYGYAEPFSLSLPELQPLFDAFCLLASIQPNGTFKHPMKHIDVPLF